MSMMRFGLLFPEIAVVETRTLKVYQARPETEPQHLPVDEYGFDELYCDERGCDCRRVMINVLARNARQHLATINHAFEKPSANDVVTEQTFLDPLNRQSSLSPALLDLFTHVVLADEEYRRRLLRHYRMFKNVVEDPAHPAHRLLHFPEAQATSEARSAAPGKSISPPPSRSGRRKRWR